MYIRNAGEFPLDFYHILRYVHTTHTKTLSLRVEIFFSKFIYLTDIAWDALSLFQTWKWMHVKWTFYTFLSRFNLAYGNIVDLFWKLVQFFWREWRKTVKCKQRTIIFCVLFEEDYNGNRKLYCIALSSIMPLPPHCLLLLVTLFWMHTIKRIVFNRKREMTGKIQKDENI